MEVLEIKEAIVSNTSAKEKTIDIRGRQAECDSYTRSEYRWINQARKNQNRMG